MPPVCVLVAWFQAEANVRVSTTNSSTTITVTDPGSGFDIDVYRYDPDDSGSPKMYSPSSASSTATWSDFKATGGTSIDTRTMWAGYSVTYCFVSTPTASSYSLKISGVSHTSSVDSNRGRRSTAKADTPANNIDICEAMLVYGTAILCDESDTPSSSEIRTFMAYDHTDSANSLYSYTKAGVETISNTGVVGTPSGEQIIYFFFTVHFSDATTTWYQSVTDWSGGSRNYNTPSLPSNEITYWKPWTSGSTDGFSSQVYSGLSFRMTELTIG